MELCKYKSETFWIDKKPIKAKIDVETTTAVAILKASMVPVYRTIPAYDLMEKNTKAKITLTRSNVLYAIDQSIPVKLKLNRITIAHHNANATHTISKKKIIKRGTIFRDLIMLVFSLTEEDSILNELKLNQCFKESISN